MINDFPWEAQPFDFFKEMLTSFIWHQEKKEIYLQKKKIKKLEAQTTSLYIKRRIWNWIFIKVRLNPKFNIYENKHISIQLPVL